MIERISKMKKLLLATCVFSLITTTHAQAVDSDSCKSLKSPTTPFLVVIKKGLPLLESLNQCLKDAHVESASFHGLGALKDPIIAYYDLAHKKFVDKKFVGVYELVSLNGNLTNTQDQKTLHIHVGLGDEEYHMLAGHLKSADVGVTAEISVIPYIGKIERKYDKETGLNLIIP